jgi:hypothetical protein
VIWVRWERKYFCKWGWTARIKTDHSTRPAITAFDLVFVVGEVNALDHGAALEHGGRAFQLQVLDQRDGIALGELCAVGIPDLDVHVVLSAPTRID